MFVTVMMWLHLIGAMAWIGGMLFFWIVLKPLPGLVRLGPESDTIMRSIELRFRKVRWASLLILVATGFFNLIHEGGSARLESSWGAVLLIKLLFVGVVLGLSGIHDFILSPSVGSSSREASSRARDVLNGLILALGFLIVFIAVHLARF
jgi:copper resistance protein D